MLYRNFDESGKSHEIFDLSCVLNGGDSAPAVINGVKDCISIAELNPLPPAAQIAKRSPFFYGDSAHFVPNAEIISDSINAIMLAKRIAKEDGHRGENTDMPLSTEEERRSVLEHENKTVIVDASGRNEAFVYRLCHLDGTPITVEEANLLKNKAKACGIEWQNKEYICFLAESGVAFKFAYCQSSALQYTLYLICDTGLLGSDLFEFAEDQPVRCTSTEGDAPSLCLQFKVSVLI